jgi:hypothetical protein
MFDLSQFSKRILSDAAYDRCDDCNGILDSFDRCDCDYPVATSLS